MEKIGIQLLLYIVFQTLQSTLELSHKALEHSHAYFCKTSTAKEFQLALTSLGLLKVTSNAARLH